MAVYFFDSSAIIKRYVSETGTAWVNGLLDPAAKHFIYVGAITGVEVIAALARQKRGNKLSALATSNALTQFRHDFSHQYQIVEISAAVVNRAMQQAENHALRGYDAVQLAAALELHINRLSLNLPGLILVSADYELNTAAVAAGLAVDDPNAHP